MQQCRMKALPLNVTPELKCVEALFHLFIFTF